MDKFDPSFEVRFSTYAVPMIAGDRRRFLRDDGMLKVSRSMKENYGKICQARERLGAVFRQRAGYGENFPGESEWLLRSLALTLESGAPVESIYKTVYQGEGTEHYFGGRLEEKKDSQEKLLNRIFLEEILERLEKDERKLNPYALFPGYDTGGDRRIFWRLPGAGVAYGKKDPCQAEIFL